jgi:serine protease inhibitor
MTSNMAIMLLAGATVALLSVAGFSVSLGVDARPGVDATPAVDAVAEVNTLGTRLFAYRIGQRPEGNIAISPLSLTIALQMAAAGASDGTEQAFRETLRLGNLPIAQAARNLGNLADTLMKHDESLIFRTANAVFLAADFKPRKNYVDEQSRIFHAKAVSLDFNDPETMDVINGWFAHETQKVIPKVISQLPADTRAVLANAFYFKGRWSIRFPGAETEPGPFHIGGKEIIDVPLMKQADHDLIYRETDRYQAVRLTFIGDTYEVLIILPRLGVNTVDWVRLLDPAGWAELFIPNGYSKRPGRLDLPRLRLSTSSELRPALEAIGLKQAFGTEADFSLLANRRVRFDRVTHATVLKWDEEGAESAASMASRAPAASAARPTSAFRMNVDRPFIVALRHVPTEALVLLALVNDPRDGSS